jgi:Holliday junction resolvasome RuvABC ATP-dependent DNA helicase subunit
MHAFSKLIGQEGVKRKLDFYLETQKKTGFFPFLNFVGAKGLGKTEFVRELSRNIIGSGGKRRPLLEINSSTIKNANQFFEQVFLSTINGQEMTIFFDEAHMLPRDLTMAFLSIFNSDNNRYRYFNYKDNNLEFDMQSQSYFFATTENDKIFAPLRDRLTMIDFSDYTIPELRDIFKMHLPEIRFEEDALDILAETSRGNARSCVLRAKEVNSFVNRYDVEVFNAEHAKQLCKILDILPLGLNKIEMNILNILRREGRCTLNMLAAKTGLSRTAIQRDHEAYLMRKNLITIDGLRHITQQGREISEAYAKSV